MPMTDQKPGNDEPALQKKRKLGRWRHEPTGNTADLDEGTYFSASTGHTSRLVMLSVRDIVGQPDWTRIPDDEPTCETTGTGADGPPFREGDVVVGCTSGVRGRITDVDRWGGTVTLVAEPPAVADVDWSKVGGHPPERVQVPKEDCDGYTPENVGFTPVGFAVHQGDGVLWANLVHGSGADHIVAHYDMTGHLTHRRVNGEMVPVKSRARDVNMLCSHGCGIALHRRRLSPEAGLHWRCSECGEPQVPGKRPASTACLECSGRKVTGMGPCSQCTKETPTPPVPEPILRICPQTKQLSLRLEVLSPERDVAKGQVKLALNQLSDVCCLDVPVALDNVFLDLWFAITNHYPRRRHLREIEAAFVEYVKAQEDAPKKPEGDAQKQEPKDEAEEGMS